MIQWLSSLWEEIKYNKFYWIFHVFGDTFGVLMLFGAFEPFKSMAVDERVHRFVWYAIVWFILFFYFEFTYKEYKDIEKK